MDLRAGISDKTEALIPALVAAQQAIRVAAKSSHNGQFGKNYADLGSVWSACREALTSNGFAVTQLTDTDGERVVLISTLLHISGQWIRSIYPVKPTKVDPQSYGSALTYARRYALASMVGVVAADEDDDANAASQPAQQQPYYAPQSAQQIRESANQVIKALGPADDFAPTEDDFAPGYGGPAPKQTAWNRLVLELANATSCDAVEDVATRAKGELGDDEFARFRVDAMARWELFANQVAAQ